MFSYQWKIFPIQQPTRSLVCLSNRISCSPASLGITINTLANKFAEFFLTISKKLFFWHNKNTIVFLPYYFNIKSKENVLGVVCPQFKCNECNGGVTNYTSSTIRLSILVTVLHSLHLYLKKNKFKNNMGETLCINVFS